MHHRDLVLGQFEHVSQALGRVDVVFDDEHPPTRHRRHCSRSGHGGLGRREREANAELGPSTRACAVGRDVATMELDQPLHQGEPQPEAAPAAIQAGVGLAERLKQASEQLGAHALTGVGDAEDGATSDGVELQGDPRHPSRRREFDGVLQEVAQDLGQAAGVGGHHHRSVGQLELERDSSLLEERALVLQRLARHEREVERLEPELNLLSSDAGDVEEVIHQVRELGRLSVDHRQRPPRLLTAWRRSLEDIGAVADRRQGVAQLMRQHGQKLVLAVVGLGELAVGFPQRLLGPLPLGDVTHHADDGAGAIDGGPPGADLDWKGAAVSSLVHRLEQQVAGAGAGELLGQRAPGVGRPQVTHREREQLLS